MFTVCIISTYCLHLWVVYILYGACIIIYKVNNNKRKTRYLII